METIEIHSHLAHFKLIQRVGHVSAHRISARTSFDGAPLYAGLEAMAQVAAMHVRHNLQFERHAFLLKVHHCHMADLKRLAGPFIVSAALRSQSSNAFGYDAVAKGDDGVEFESELLIGTRGYDDRFRKDVLCAHYQTLWAELREA